MKERVGVVVLKYLAKRCFLQGVTQSNHNYKFSFFVIFIFFVSCSYGQRFFVDRGCCIVLTQCSFTVVIFKEYNFIFSKEHILFFWLLKGSVLVQDLILWVSARRSALLL